MEWIMHTGAVVDQCGAAAADEAQKGERRNKAMRSNESIKRHGVLAHPSLLCAGDDERRGGSGVQRIAGIL